METEYKLKSYKNTLSNGGLSAEVVQQAEVRETYLRFSSYKKGSLSGNDNLFFYSTETDYKNGEITHEESTGMMLDKESAEVLYDVLSNYLKK